MEVDRCLVATRPVGPIHIAAPRFVYLTSMMNLPSSMHKFLLEVRFDNAVRNIAFRRPPLTHGVRNCRY